MINFDSKINIMTPIHIRKLGFQMQKTNIRIQKIDRSTLETYERVIISFQVQNKLKNARFLLETFLIVDIIMEVIFKIIFLTFSKVKINFAKRKLI